jgi:hypothetical protein
MQRIGLHAAYASSLAGGGTWLMGVAEAKMHLPSTGYVCKIISRSIPSTVKLLC